MPYLKGKLKGELKVAEIRKLVRLHNDLSKIKIPPKTDRDGIIKIIKSSGYDIDHMNAKLVSTKSTMPKEITLEQANKTFPKKPRVKKVVEVVKPKPTFDPKNVKVVGIKGAKPKPAPAPAKPAPAKQDFKVKSTDRKKLNNAFINKYDKSIYQVLKKYGLGSEAVAKKTSPAELKKISKRIRLDTHPDKGGSPEDFDMFNNAIKVLLDTSIVSETPAPKPAPKPKPTPVPKSNFDSEFKKFFDAVKPGSDWAGSMSKAKSLKEINDLMKVYTGLLNDIESKADTDAQDTRIEKLDEKVREFRFKLVDKIKSK